jgi:hypothetical protein
VRYNLVQARFRGILKRNDLYNGEAAMNVHLVVIEDQHEKHRERLVEEYSFKDLDQLINRSDHRDYLNEVGATRKALQNKIRELEEYRYYLPAAQQRQVCKQ